MSDGFTETRWTLVNQVREGDTQQKKDALEVVCGRYWKPLYWFARRRGLNHEEAADAIQSFFAKLLESERLGDADRRLGKLRTFLLTHLKGHLSDRQKHEQALKRQPSAGLVSFDSEEGKRLMEESAGQAQLSLEAGFDREWARATLDHCLSRLRAAFTEKGQLPLFDALVPAIISEDEPLSTKDIAQTLGQEEGTVRVAKHRLRKRLQESLRDEVSATLEAGDNLSDELRYLAALLN